MFYELFVQFKFSYWFKDCLFLAKYRINFTTTTRSTIMSSICVTVPTEDQKLVLTFVFPFVCQIRPFI